MWPLSKVFDSVVMIALGSKTCGEFALRDVIC